jgi:excisionase family DNA binding protein
MITTREAAATLGVSRQRLLVLLDRHQIPRQRVGPLIVLTPEAMQMLIDKRKPRVTESEAAE